MLCKKAAVSITDEASLRWELNGSLVCEATEDHVFLEQKSRQRLLVHSALLHKRFTTRQALSKPEHGKSMDGKIARISQRNH